jgi:hypothetical protein
MPTATARLHTTRGPFAALLPLLLAGSAAAQVTSTWNGSTGNWTDVARWSTPNFPNNGNGGVNYNAVVNAGTVTLNQDITVTGFTMGGGTVSAPGAGGPFTLTATNTLNWTGGTFGAGQTLRSNGTATIDFPGLGGTFNNAGTATLNSMTGTAGAIMNNLAGATMTQTTGALFGSGTFNNAGTYSATGGHTFNWAFNNQAGGVVNLTNANLQLIDPRDTRWHLQLDAVGIAARDRCDHDVFGHVQCDRDRRLYVLQCQRHSQRQFQLVRERADLGDKPWHDYVQ